jgi:hypothetical protein
VLPSLIGGVCAFQKRITTLPSCAGPVPEVEVPAGDLLPSRYSPPSFLRAPHDPLAVSTSDSETSKYRHFTWTFPSELT